MPKTRSFRGWFLLLLVLAAAGLATWYYLRGRATAAPEYSTAKVTRGDVTQAVTATGDLQPVVTVDVGAQVSGQVKDVLVDFNSKVKAGDVLARIDPSTAEQKLRQAQADLESAKANNQLLRINADRTRELSKRNLVSQSELDTIEAQLAQSNATMLLRTAAVENAKLDLERCTITSPIDGIVLTRNTDRGRTVNASMNAPVLFTLVNDLTKMQINAAVAEADVGAISEGQEVTFTVDAFPNRTFNGSVRQVRNAATTTQSVVSYATIIDVNNDELRLKPGMTANVSIIVAQKTNVLRVPNAALRARIPAELMPKPPAAPAGKAAGPAPAPLNEQDRRALLRTVMTEVGIQFGSPASAEQVERFKKLAAEKGLDAETVNQIAGRLAGGGRGPGGPGGPGGGRRGGGGTGPAPVTTRTLYKLVAADGARKIEAVSARIGVSDGTQSEVVEGLAENDDVITSVTLPGAAPAAAPGGQNPFQQRGFGPGGFGGGGGGRR